MNQLATLEPEIVVELDRQCPQCRKIRLASEFQDAPDGVVFNTCRTCRQPVDDDKTALARQYAKQLAAGARGGHIESPHIAEVNAEMMRLLGGVTGFCKSWFDQLQMAIVDKPGSKMVLDQFKEIVKLNKSATELRSSAPDVATLTDAELGEEMLALAMKVLPAKLEDKT